MNILKDYYKNNGSLEAGVDEVGRGCLSGPVVAGAVIWDPEIKQEKGFIIRDSKKVSARKRLILKDFIEENAIDTNVHFVDNKRVDYINIYHASQEAMHKAIRGLRVNPELLLIDGDKFSPYMDDNDEYLEYVCIPGGDDKYCSIGAASILAKCARDKWIEELCDKCPELDEKYNWRKNKGYGTMAHMEGIQEYGITEWHRKSFGPCKLG